MSHINLNLSKKAMSQYFHLWASWKPCGMVAVCIPDSNFLQAWGGFYSSEVSGVEPFEILDGDGEFAKQLSVPKLNHRNNLRSENSSLVSDIESNAPWLSKPLTMCFLWVCGEHSKIYFWTVMQEETQSWSPSIDWGRQLNPATRTSTLVHLEIPTSENSSLHQSRRVEELCLCSGPVRYNRRQPPNKVK